MGALPMGTITHLPANCFAIGIVEVIAEHGVVIAGDLVSSLCLRRFNQPMQNFIDHCEPDDYCETQGM